MDTSQQYIQMCKAAQEIQDLWEPINGDVASIDGSPKTEVIDGATLVMYERRISKHTLDIWLPRQDQLQEMLFGKSLRSQSKTLTKYLSQQVSEISWEQLWLIIIMGENYQKVWNFINKQWEII